MSFVKSALRKALPAKSPVGRFVRIPRDKAIDRRERRLRRLLDEYAESHADVVFVQIGSHDGETTDPIAPYIDRFSGWTGVFVEPIPELFAQLERKRSDTSRFRVVRAAITSFDGQVDMTMVQAEGAPSWASKLSSISEDVVMRHEKHIPNLDARLVTVSVPAMTFESLTKDLTRIDLVHIDTEGHDAVILDQIDLERWHPSVLMFEHKHLEKSARARCRRRLESAGYTTVSGWFDTLAVKPRQAR